ncbi:ArsR-like helix-turn-helix domain-containing protein [Dioscorea alata]|uniref:ArsR-like helix-turn-helix domain-containing protein n=2 Tax=Dioscorea alata TaxID=55571 RepID=A0ACB7VC69_DIOAL|nr:ArsR-like helix-turn-helix domain-containing protein [Dioscorea alata]KAH7671376.1 ArsR-like helix-turn-helix domain-containing protein [Dioscorea alata]
MASISTCFASTTRLSHFPCLAPLPKSSLLLLRSSPNHPHTLSRRFRLAILVNPLRPRVSIPIIRASVQVPSGIRPGGAVETDKLSSDVRKRAMDAVDSYGGRVTIGDVASRAGLKLDEAERALQALAADTGGFLEVSDEGDVLYVFPRDYRTKLAAKSFKMKVEPLLDKSKAAAAYLIRVSFGTALIASIVLVYTTIIALISSRSDEDNRGRRGGRSYYDSGGTFFFRPSDLFWYWDPYYYRRKQERDNGMNFIESVFSFVFGDGDPNQGIEEERWKLIGQYITSNGGVVAAEELAPYLDVPSGNETVDDESYILPVLLRFDGHPEVDDEGNILYRFPSLQRTASSQKSRRKEYVGKKWAEAFDGARKFFQEKKWLFSKTGSSERAMVIGLGALNFFGVVILGSMLKSVAAAPQGLVSFVSEIFPFLQIYAASFFAIPVFRWFLLLRTNASIERRNLARQQRARALELPNPTLRSKLLNARDMAQRMVIGSDKIVYSTQKDLIDQDYDARDWERRFKELEKSD